MELAIIALLITTVLSIVFAAKYFRQSRNFLKRFSTVIDVDTEIANLKNTISLLEKEKHDKRNNLSALGENYIKAKEIFDKLSQQISLLEENIEDISFGIYKPHFNFKSSEDYKNKLEQIRVQRKTLVKEGKATHCPAQWEVAGSKREGARMTKQYTKLLLRAFNGESDAAIARVRWNNATRTEERIKKAFEAINDLGSTMQMSINPEYLQVCLDELRLEYELEEKKYQEQEEQRKIRERLREEEKAQREYEKAQREAEQDEARFHKALDKARAEISFATGKELTDLNEKIQLLEQRVKEAEAIKQRAISMAQQTRCGYLYVISNLGTFGEEVLKIGMTRRLDPMDRVRELGDASVPFGFDVHAMVYSDDAPALEAELHSFFADYRVNLVNLRREFFRVPLHDVAKFISGKGLKIELSNMAEAKEYRETLAMRMRKEQPIPVDMQSQFPESLLAVGNAV